MQIGKAAAGVVLDKINPKWALVGVLIGAAGFNSLMAAGNTLTWFNITWFLSRAVYVSPSNIASCLSVIAHLLRPGVPWKPHLVYIFVYNTSMYAVTYVTLLMKLDLTRTLGVRQHNVVPMFPGLDKESFDGQKELGQHPVV